MGAPVGDLSAITDFATDSWKANLRFAVNQPEQRFRSTMLPSAGLAEAFVCSNRSGLEYPCATPSRGQLLSHLCKRRGRS